MPPPCKEGAFNYMPSGIYKRIIGINCGLPSQGFQKGCDVWNKGKKGLQVAWNKSKRYKIGKISSSKGRHYSPKEGR